MSLWFNRKSQGGWQTVASNGYARTGTRAKGRSTHGLGRFDFVTRAHAHTHTRILEGLLQSCFRERHDCSGGVCSTRALLKVTGNVISTIEMFGAARRLRAIRNMFILAVGIRSQFDEFMIMINVDSASPCAPPPHTHLAQTPPRTHTHTQIHTCVHTHTHTHARARAGSWELRTNHESPPRIGGGVITMGHDKVTHTWPCTASLELKLVRRLFEDHLI